MTHSESIKNIAASLSLFQGEIKNPANTAVNPFFKSKYAPLSEILNVIRPALVKNGLSILQSTECVGDTVSVSTMILHASGEWIESDKIVLKPEKVTPQGAGSAITYARRYSLSALINISSEDDDDANHAEPTKPVTTKPANQPKAETITPVNAGAKCPSCHAPAGKPHASDCKMKEPEAVPDQKAELLFKIEAGINSIIDKNAPGLANGQRKDLFSKTLKRLAGHPFISDLQKLPEADLLIINEIVSAELTK